MTTADDFVIQFIQDKGLVTSAQVAEARAELGQVPEGQPPDTAALAKLVEGGKVTWAAITQALGLEFDMEVVDVAQVTPAGKLPKYSYIPELNLALAALAKELDRPEQRVVSVDLATGFDVATDTIADRVHPNARGAEKIAQRWAEALTPWLK